MRFQPMRYRPTFGRVLSVAVAVMALVTTVMGVVEIGIPSLLETIPGAAFVTTIAWALFWRPEVAIDSDAVTVRNVLRTFTIPWAAIERIDTKWALAIYTTSGRVTAWAAPAPSRYATASVDPNDFRIIGAPGEAVRPGDTLGTASGAVAFVIRSHWKDLDLDGRLTAVTPEQRVVSKRWNRGTIAAIAVLLGLTILSAVI